MTVTHLKAHLLFYQMHRMKYKRGGKKRKHGGRTEVSSLSNFEEVENKFTRYHRGSRSAIGV
jgi:hypothetical protein